MQRLVLLDSDMLCTRNMDELLEMPLENGWIAAAHACTCNPKKHSHYPLDWSVRAGLSLSCPRAQS